jgi:hypothetical protein
VHVLDFGKNALTEFPSKLVLLAGSRYIWPGLPGHRGSWIWLFSSIVM